MADFLQAFLRFKGIEFSRPDNILHKNKGENGLTYYGIYQSAHPKWSGWKKIKHHLSKHNQYRKRASVSASKDFELTLLVMEFYHRKFWKTLRLDEIKSQKIAEELFFFYLNTGSKKRTVRYAQQIVGAVADGSIGRNTIKALNTFNEDVFDRKYDDKQIVFYERLAKGNPKRYGRFLKGWKRRAVLI